MKQSPAERIRANCFNRRKEQLNSRVRKFLSAYGLPNYGDNLVMNMVIMQLQIDDFYCEEGKIAYKEILRDYWDLQSISDRVLRLRKSS